MTHPIESQAHRADSAAIAAILKDTRDEPLRNKATRVALEVLKRVEGEVDQGGEIMLTSLAHYAGKSHVVCSTARNTVLFMGKHAFVLARENGDGVPWVSNERMHVPDMTFFHARVRIDDGLSENLMEYVEDLMDQAREAVEHMVEDDHCHAPSH